MTTPDTIKEEFEKIGMVRVLKEAQGFNKAQYLLMIKLFGDFILSKALDEQREEMKEKIMNTLDSIDKKRTETLKNSQSTYSENGYAYSYEIVKLLLKEL